MKLIKIISIFLVVLILTGCQNPHPYSNPDFISVLKNGERIIDVLLNDEQLDYPDSLELVITAQPENGTVRLNEDQTITYTPDEAFLGFDTFEYQIVSEKDDRETTSNASLVTVNVKATNSAPIANDDHEIVIIDRTTHLLVLPNDIDEDDEVNYLSIISVGEPEHGKVILSHGVYITYVPDKRYEGNDQFTYTLSDGIETSEATVYLTVKENSKPIANDDYVTVLLETIDSDHNQIIIDVLANDTDADDQSLFITSVKGSKHGKVISGNGEIVYEPDKDYLGEVVITYEITDGYDTSVATVTITIE